MSREDFLDNVKLINNEEESEIENLQISFKSGYILEKDIPEEKLSKLISLYEEQNMNLENKLDIAKTRIRDKLNNIK